MAQMYLRVVIFLLGFIGFYTNSFGSCVFAQEISIKELPIGNILEWATIEEQNNQYFSILRSDNGVEFEMIGQVEGAGQSKEEKQYRFLDHTTGLNHAFYKIQQIDFDGQTTETPVFVLQRSKSNNFAVQSMSQTMTDRLFTVTVHATQKGMGTVEVLDLTQEKQIEKEVYFIEGKNVISLNLETLNNGKYFIQIQKGDELEQLLIRKVDPTQVPTVNYVIKNN